MEETLYGWMTDDSDSESLKSMGEPNLDAAMRSLLYPPLSSILLNHIV